MMMRQETNMLVGRVKYKICKKRNEKFSQTVPVINKEGIGVLTGTLVKLTQVVSVHSCHYTKWNTLYRTLGMGF